MNRPIAAAVALLGAAALLALLSLLPPDWMKRPRAAEPLAIELQVTDRSIAARPTRGMTVGSNGFGTILAAPPRRVEPSPDLPVPDAPALEREPAIAASVAGLLRLVARLAPVPPQDDLMVTLEMPPHNFSKVILRNGCLRLAETGEPQAILPVGARLYIDKDGYLTIGVLANGDSANPRIGEPLWWEGGNPPLDPAALARIRQRCGPGRARLLGLAQSVSASQAINDGLAAKSFADRYGVSWKQALSYVRRCRERLAANLPPLASGERPVMVDNMCGSAPPPPVPESADCPSGTSLSGGLCRTPEGHIRPLPPL